MPEDRDYYPPEFTVNLFHLVAGQNAAPWTGWYANYKGVKLAVSNAFGAWFEIRKCENTWEAFRLARTELKVQGSALPGINVHTLMQTGEPTNEEIVEEIKRAHSESRASQRDPPPHQDPPQQPTGDPDRDPPKGLHNYRPR
jgi:hypothetical protein